MSVMHCVVLLQRARSELTCYSRKLSRRTSRVTGGSTEESSCRSVECSVVIATRIFAPKLKIERQKRRQRARAKHHHPAAGVSTSHASPIRPLAQSALPSALLLTLLSHPPSCSLCSPVRPLAHSVLPSALLLTLLSRPPSCSLRSLALAVRNRRRASCLPRGCGGWRLRVLLNECECCWVILLAIVTLCVRAGALLLRVKRLAAGGSCCSCRRRLQVLVWLLLPLLLTPPPLMPPLPLASTCSCAPAGSIRRDNQRYDGIAFCEQAKAALQVAAGLSDD